MIMYVMRNKESLSGHLPPRYLKYMEAFCLLRCHNVTFLDFLYHYKYIFNSSAIFGVVIAGNILSRYGLLVK